MNRSRPETRRYDIRTEGDRRWLGTFLVTHDGLVACNTDYGSYSYWWTSTGCDDIRAFLVKINTGYLLRKFSPREEYDGEDTEKAIKEFVIRARRDGVLSCEEARAEWDLICDLDRETGFAFWLRDTKLGTKHGFGDLWELACHRTNPEAAAFAEHVWPAFVKRLREEMEAERIALDVALGA